MSSTMYVKHIYSRLASQVPQSISKLSVTSRKILSVCVCVFLFLVFILIYSMANGNINLTNEEIKGRYTHILDIKCARMEKEPTNKKKKMDMKMPKDIQTYTFLPKNR